MLRPNWATARGFAALLFLWAVLAVLAGCADRDTSGDNDRRGGFYGGVTGGMSRP